MRGHRTGRRRRRALSSDAAASIIDDAGHPELPRDPEHHASAIAATEVLRRAGAMSVGLSLTVEKGLPLSGGQGGSAASAIAGAFAVNELIGRPLSQNDLLLAALVAEQRVAGRHLDNLAPALLGGAVLVRSIEPLDVVRLPTPPALRFVLVHPDMRLRTADARAVLPRAVDLPTAMAQAGAVAKMVWALASGDVEQLRGTIDDRIAEPARAPLLPGFAAAKQAAIDAGALGCSIAGGGPSSFAMANGDARRRTDARGHARRVPSRRRERRPAASRGSTTAARVSSRPNPRLRPTRRDHFFISSRQQCEQCGHSLGELDPAPVCPVCGGLLELLHADVPHAHELPARFAERRRAMSGPDASGVWRYRELVLPSVTNDVIVSHPEGNTPLLDRARVAEFAGVERLLMKHEGHNPTGSFKDRGMTVAMTQARRTGARAVACASTGNTSASLAAYAAQAGFRRSSSCPAGQVALGKLTQTLAYGARTLLVRGNFDDCLTLARSASEALNVQLLNSINPFRLEGQKSIVFELLDQLDWDPPDWIALPAGNLGNTSAFGKALREARTLGLIPRMPRIAAVQAQGAAPFARSFQHHFERAHSRRPGNHRDGDPHRRPRVVGSRRARHPRDERRRHVGDRRSDSRRQGGDRRGGRWVRARERGERRRRQATPRRRRDRAKRSRRRGAHRPSAQGSGRARAVPSGNGTAAGTRESPDRDRTERRALWSGCSIASSRNTVFVTIIAPSATILGAATLCTNRTNETRIEPCRRRAITHQPQRTVAQPAAASIRFVVISWSFVHNGLEPDSAKCVDPASFGGIGLGRDSARWVGATRA